MGLGLHFSGYFSGARIIWAIATLPVLGSLLVEILRSFMAKGVWAGYRRGDVDDGRAGIWGNAGGFDCRSQCILGEPFLKALPRDEHAVRCMLCCPAHREQQWRYVDDHLEEIAVETIRPGDRLLIRQGDVIPVDGSITSVKAFVNMSALTGESLPISLTSGADALSGSVNAGDAFDIVARHEAKDSTYAGIVRLVEEAPAFESPDV
ncbi:P-type ATPase [Brucella anthropi]|uniref:P-type ATPase n=1 Tax=Brucella anthropi TaxID=529 RepID=UPI000E07AF3C|nr:hypothetical protein [Brucella anthropi]SUB55971.1 Cation-transporting ATPase PacS [Brucella anthropi]